MTGRMPPGIPRIESGERLRPGDSGAPVALLVHDRPGVLDETAGWLRDEGYEPVVVENLGALASGFPRDVALAILDVELDPASREMVLRGLSDGSGSPTPPPILLALDPRERRRWPGRPLILERPLVRSRVIAAARLAAPLEGSVTARSAEDWARRIPPAEFTKMVRRVAPRTDREVALATARAGRDPWLVAPAIGVDSLSFARRLGSELDLPVIDWIPPDAVTRGRLSDSFCRRRRVAPLEFSGRAVLVACNPYDWDLLKTLGETLGSRRRFRLALAPPAAFAELYGDRPVRRSSASHRRPTLPPEPGPRPERRPGTTRFDPKPGPTAVEDHPDEPREDAVDEVREVTRVDSPIALLGRRIIESALEERASDIHIEPKPRETLVRVRVDGDMRIAFRLGRRLGAKVISRYKVLCGLDIAERRKPQDGSFAATFEGRELQLRLATTATPDGESVVIRILEPNRAPPDLATLGLAEDQTRALVTAAERSQGLILVVGPTGSGKTTTIYSLLHSIDCQSRSLMTIEDPVEYRIRSANQQELNPAAGITFQSLLRSALRQDPDILYLGEIRDGLSAEAAMEIASSGHLGIATMHAANTTNTITRLERLSVDRIAMSEAISCVHSQRLARRPCEVCRVLEAPTDEERARLAPFGDVPDLVVHEVGCETCKGLGTLGRLSVAEVLVWDREIRRLVAEGLPADDLRDLLRRDPGRRLFADRAFELVESGAISPAEAWRRVLVDESSDAPEKATSLPAAPETTRPAPAAPVPAAPVPAAPVPLLPEPTTGAAPLESPAPRAHPEREDDELPRLSSRTAAAEAESPGGPRPASRSEAPSGRGSSPGVFGVRTRRRDSAASELAKGVSEGVSSRELGPGRVLVAEDDPVLGSILRHILESRGHVVTLVTDGADAVFHLAREPFDLVISDLSMPNLDGRALIGFLRGKSMDVPIIVVTGKTDEADEVSTLEAGADDFIRKPVNFTTFLARVEARLRRSRSRRGGQDRSRP